MHMFTEMHKMEYPYIQTGIFITLFSMRNKFYCFNYMHESPKSRFNNYCFQSRANGSSTSRVKHSVEQERECVARMYVSHRTYTS